MKGFLVTAQVMSESYFDQYEAAVTASVNAALVEWGAVTLDKILEHETRVGTRPHDRYISYNFPYQLRDRAGWGVAIAKVRGFGLLSSNIVVYTENPNAIWQELGTRRRRKKTLKSGAKGGFFSQSSGNAGVSPLYFMRKGTRDAYPIGVELMRAALATAGRMPLNGTPWHRMIDTTSRSETGKPPRPFGEGDIVS